VSIDWRLIGFATLAGWACFHAPSPVSRSTVRRNHDSSSFILPCRVSSSEFLRCSLPRTILSDSRSCQGFVPFTTSPSASTAHGDSHFPLRSVLRHSQPLDVLLRALASRACSIPQPSRGFSFRGFFRDAATLPHRKELPPCRWLTTRSPTKPRLESMSTGDGLGFGALLHITLRSLGSAVRPSEGSLPSSSFVSPRFRSLVAGSAYPARPLMKLRDWSSTAFRQRWPNRAFFSVSSTRNSANLSPNRQPAREFRTFSPEIILMNEVPCAPTV